MNWLFTVLVVLIIVAAICLVIAVLLQNGKGEGLTTNFTAANQTLGVRGAANLLEKVTWGLVAFILIVSIASTFAMKGNFEGKSKSDVVNEIVNENAPATEFPTAELPDPAAPSAAPADAPAASDAPAPAPAE